METLNPSLPTPATRAEYNATVGRLRAAADAYYSNGEVVMDDPTYDAHVRGLAAAEKAHPDWTSPDSPTQLVGSAPVAADKAVTHRTPMLSLDNLFEVDGDDPYAEVDAWVASREKALGRPISAYVVEKKYDGSACSALYENGRLVRIATRGDGTTGENRSYAIDRVTNLPRTLSAPFTGEVRGEVMFRTTDYTTASEARVASGKAAYVNARNAAAGAFSAETLAYDVTLTFFPYSATGLEGVDSHSASLNALRELGFTIADDAVALCHTAAEIKAAVHALSESRSTLDHDIDGAVIKVDLISEQNELGLGSRVPRWGTAFKYPADHAIATLEEVTWDVGRTGVIAPRARITPTFVGGTTVTFATLHNVEDMARKGFMLHDKVTVKRAGEVIPRLEAPVVNLRDGSQTSIEIPQACPRCGSEIDKSQVRWRCSRGRECNALASVEYGVSRDALDIEGAGSKLVRQMVETDLVSDIGDLFTLTMKDLMGLERMGETSAAKLLEQIEAAKTRPLSRVFTALGVRGTGRSLSRRIAKHFGTMEAIRAASAEDFEAVDGIGAEKAPWIVAELTDVADVIDKLVAAGVNMAEESAAADGTATPGELPLAGMTVVATGSMTGPLAALSRNQVNELIERAGGKSSGSVSKNTSLLVAGDGAGSKLAKATSLGVAVATPEEFAERVAAFLP